MNPSAGRSFTTATWKKYTEWPLLAVAIVFLAAYSTQVIADMKDNQSPILDTIIWITWGLFLIDYIIQLYLAEQKKKWFIHNIPTLIILLLPVLRPLRLLRLVILLKLLQTNAFKLVSGKIVIYVLGAATLLVYVGALAVLDAEQNTPGAKITNFGDALWWAVTTITTVGYGDYYPITLVGRLVAAGLMIGGIAVLGVVTASLASWLIDQIRNPPLKSPPSSTEDS